MNSLALSFYLVLFYLSSVFPLVLSSENNLFWCCLELRNTRKSRNFKHLLLTIAVDGIFEWLNANRVEARFALLICLSWISWYCLKTRKYLLFWVIPTLLLHTKSCQWQALAWTTKLAFLFQLEIQQKHYHYDSIWNLYDRLKGIKP